MPMQAVRTNENELMVELWPEGLTARAVSARIVTLAPGVLCLATGAPPVPGARFVAKFSVRGEFPIVVGCQARWRLERTAGEYWVSATFLTLDARDWEILSAAYRLRLSRVVRYAAGKDRFKNVSQPDMKANV